MHLFSSRKTGQALTRRSRLAGIAAIAVLGLVAGSLDGAAAGRDRHAGECAGRNGPIAVIREQPGGDELGLLAGGRFTRLYKVPFYRESPYHRLADPSFSCDGRRIVVSQSGGKPFRALVVVDITDHRAHVVPTDHHQPAYPVFLADGRIVFSGPTTHRQPHTSFGFNRRGGTFVVDPDGSHLHRLFARREIAASRDGRFFIVFSKPEGGRLLLLDARGRLLRALTPPPKRGRAWGEASFSSDGRRIVLVEGFGAREHNALSLAWRDRPRLRRLGSGRGSASEPSFSPAGRQILFIKSSSGMVGQPWLRVLGAGGKERRLHLRSGFEYPIWGPR